MVRTSGTGGGAAADDAQQLGSPEQWRAWLGAWGLACSPGLLVVLVTARPGSLCWAILAAATSTLLLDLLLRSMTHGAIVRPGELATTLVVLVTSYTGLVSLSDRVGMAVLLGALVTTPACRAVVAARVPRRQRP